jgi:hypothetical protein
MRRRFRSWSSNITASAAERSRFLPTDSCVVDEAPGAVLKTFGRLRGFALRGLAADFSGFILKPVAGAEAEGVIEIDVAGFAEKESTTLSAPSSRLRSCFSLADFGLGTLNLLSDEVALALLIRDREAFFRHGRFLLGEGLRRIVDPCNEPALLRLVDPSDTAATEVLAEFRERDPASGVHMHVALVADELLVDTIGEYALRSKSIITIRYRFVCSRQFHAPARQELYEVVLELRREVGDVTACVLADNEHLPQMCFGLSMTLESILVPALFLADLTEPPQALKALGLHLVRQILRRSD